MTVATYHNHTTWSDGKASIAETIAAAAAIGVDELGISDHFVLHPLDRVYDWAIKLDQIDDYVHEIIEHAADAPLTVLLGLEVDWFPGHGDAIADALSTVPTAFLVGAVHEVDGTILDGSLRVWNEMNEEQINVVYHDYWLAMADMASSGLFDIAGHIDLPKKHGFLPTVTPQTAIDTALDAMAESNIIVEINTAGWHKRCADAYPTVDLLQQCRRRDIPITISADAHQPDHLLRDFDRAAARLREAGYDEIARLGPDGVRLESIDDAAARV